ncbi:hypothetical protein NT04LS_2896, partial [Listeria seeligeri FSL S4-171]
MVTKKLSVYDNDSFRLYFYAIFVNWPYYLIFLVFSFI